MEIWLKSYPKRGSVAAVTSASDCSDEPQASIALLRDDAQGWRILPSALDAAFVQKFARSLFYLL